MSANLYISVDDKEADWKKAIEAMRISGYHVRASDELSEYLIKGQKVNIRFNNYPDKEFGIVKGTVKNISLIPVVDGQDVKSYMVDIQLPNGLRTSYNKELPFLPGMEGQADIITEDISLLERFLMPIKKVITEGLKNEDSYRN